MTKRGNESTTGIKLNRKKLSTITSLALLLAAVLCLGVFASGCSSTKTTAGDNNGNSLTISVINKDPNMDAAIKKFEKLHPGITIEVKEYTSNPQPAQAGKGMVSMIKNPADIEKYVTAINTQLMSGQNSDIILLNDLPYETYAEKNLLVNLSDLMQKDQSFDSSKYYQNILDALKYKGSLFGLPVSFSIDTVAADNTLLENAKVTIDDNSWKWNDFVQIAEKVIGENRDGEDQYALAGMDEKGLINALVKGNYNRLVDRETKKANFTGQEFLDILNLSKNLIDNKLVNTDTSKTNLADLTARGNLLFNVTPLRGFMDMQAAKGTFSEGVQILNLPGSEGNIGFTTGNMYGISRTSSQKELAWEFLKLLISDETMSQMSLGGFPINKSVVPIIAEESMKMSQKGGGKLMIKGPNGGQAQTLTLKPLTQEDIDFVQSLLEKANVYNGTDQKIIAIIQEETTAFFTGQKTAEITAQLIQDRVSTYLNE